MKRTKVLMTLFVLLLIVAITQIGTAFENKAIESASTSGYYKNCDPTPKPTSTVVPTIPKPTPPTTTNPTPEPTATVNPTPVVTSTPGTNPGNDQAPSFRGSSGGGGCGRDVRTYESQKNVRKHEAREEFVYYKKLVNYTFRELEFLKGASFLPNQSEQGCISGWGELLKIRSENTVSIVNIGPAIYFNVWVGGIGYSDSNRVIDRYIKFGIPDELKNKNISLMEYWNGSWTEVELNHSEKVITAKVRHFGYFALVEKTNPAMDKAINSTIVEKNDDTKSSNAASYVILIVLLILLAAVFVYAKKRGK